MKTYREFITESTDLSVKTNKAGTLTFKKSNKKIGDTKGEFYLATSPVEYQEKGMKGDVKSGKAEIGFDDEKMIVSVKIEKSESYDAHEFIVYAHIDTAGRENPNDVKLYAIKTLFSRKPYLDGQVLAKSSQFTKIKGLVSW